jgi:hypothetical protein
MTVRDNRNSVVEERTLARASLPQCPLDPRRSGTARRPGRLYWWTSASLVLREMRVYALSILAGRRRAATRPMSPNTARAIIATA